MDNNERNDDELALYFIARKIRNIQNIENINDSDLLILTQAVDDLFSYMSTTKYNESPTEKAKLDQMLNKIYKAEISEIENNFSNCIDLHLKQLKNEEFFGLYHDGKSITLNTFQLYKPLKSEDFEERMAGCKRIVQTISHEIQHHRQYVMATRSVSSKEAMTFGKDYAVIRTMEKNFYTDNYSEMAIENDANEKATEKMLGTVGYNEKDAYTKLVYNLNKRLSQYNAEYTKAKYRINESNSVESQVYFLITQDKDDLLDKILDDAILKHNQLHLLSDYPILEKIYNDDGTKKDSKQLIDDMKNEKEEYLSNPFLTDTEKEIAISDSEDMYLDLLYKSLEKTTPSELKEIDSNLLSETLDKMENKFENEATNLTNVLGEYFDFKRANKKDKFPLSRFFNNFINTFDRKSFYSSVQKKLKEQKKFINGVRNGKIHAKKSKVETQALQVVSSPLKRFKYKLHNIFFGFTQKSDNLSVSKDETNNYEKSTATQSFKAQLTVNNLENNKKEEKPQISHENKQNSIDKDEEQR